MNAIYIFLLGSIVWFVGVLVLAGLPMYFVLAKKRRTYVIVESPSLVLLEDSHEHH